MACPVCLDGFVVLEWTDAPADFGICLCEAGQALRRATNNGHAAVPLWRIWCARWQFDPARVFLLEDIYSPSELAAVGLVTQAGAVDRAATLRAIGRGKVRA